MPTEILMPALSPTMEEGKLAKWLVKEGQTIKPGDIIAEIETDKATMEVEAVDEGKVSKLLVAEGTEGVKVNTPIAVLDGEAAAPGEVLARRCRRLRLPQPRAATRPPPPGGEGLGVGEPLRVELPPSRRALPHKGSEPLPTQPAPPAPKPPRRPCARRCAMPWPRRCGATRPCS